MSAAGHTPTSGSLQGARNGLNLAMASWIAVQGLSRYQRLPTSPERITVSAQKKIQTTYSAGFTNAVVEPKKPATTTVSSPMMPRLPPTTRGHGERAIGTSHGVARRGYSIVLPPT